MADTMKMPEGLSKVEQFFWEHAGLSYSPDSETPEQGRERGAKALAKAEQVARESGYTFQWERDDTTNEDFEDSGKDEPYRLWCCIGRDGQGKLIASLGGVDFGRDVEPWGQPYRRVVEAELASESMPE